MAAVVIADRQDIHKSCKSIETLVNVLNDYCEALSAIAAIRKKLAKSLRDSATVRSTAETAANALNASAVVFENVYEVDHKSAKWMDKECEGISNEVKKWFKKLAKEEKAHDDKIAHANAKIKQAGLLYEKKAKKYPREAQEEHTRYIALLTSLGPEITQDKYNHSLSVSRRHTTILQQVAGCLSRVAETEWQRSCEEVRRISPNVGSLGEWRSLCEGGWTNPIPPDLRDPTELATVPSNRPDRDLAVPPGEPVLLNSRGTTPTLGSWVPSTEPSPIDHPHPQESLAPELAQFPEGRNNSATSLTSLGSFPAPPTHFPLPPVHPMPQDEADKGIAKNVDVVKEENNDMGTRLHSEREGPRKHLQISTRPNASSSDGPSSAPTPIEASSPAVPFDSKASSPQQEKKSPVAADHNEQALVKWDGPQPQSARQNVSTSSSGGISSPGSNPSAKVLPRGDYTDGAEFGVRKVGEPTPPKNSKNGSPQVVERSDTGRSNGSMVAALRDRYSRVTGQSSPPPKEVPRIPLSVTNLATRYESPASSPTPPRQTSRAPTEERRRYPADPRTMDVHDREVVPMPRPFPSDPSTHEAGAYRLRMEEVRELELREQEHRLRLREHAIEEQALDLERERVRLLTARRGQQQPTSDRGWVTSPSATSLSDSRHAYSNSTTRLATPPSQYTSKPLYSSPSSSPILPPPEHAPYCGCETCSTSKYGVRNHKSSPRDLRPPEPPISLRPEKPKGWIRRLSMPVMGGAFSDSKKGSNNTTLGVGYRSSMALADEDGRIRGMLGGGSRNRSTSNLGGR